MESPFLQAEGLRLQIIPHYSKQFHPEIFRFHHLRFNHRQVMAAQESQPVGQAELVTKDPGRPPTTAACPITRHEMSGKLCPLIGNFNLQIHYCPVNFECTAVTTCDLKLFDTIVLFST
jgi:hypothetical protein